MSDTNFKFNTSETVCLIFPAKSSSVYKISTHFVTQAATWLPSSAHPCITKCNTPPKSLKSTSKTLLLPPLHLFQHHRICHHLLLLPLQFRELNTQFSFYSPPLIIFNTRAIILKCKLNITTSLKYFQMLSIVLWKCGLKMSCMTSSLQSSQLNLIYLLVL